MYETVKTIHILAWASWMAGLFYLPRIFVYHAEATTPGDATSETFKVMERKLHRFIMGPAMIATWITGLWLAWTLWGSVSTSGWFWVKAAMVIAMTGFHHMAGAWVRRFAADANERPGRFYRIANEAPTLLFVVIVVMVIVRPF